MQIYSDRPASEVLANHAAALPGNTPGEESAAAASRKDALLPSHHALVVGTLYSAQCATQVSP